MKDRSQHILNAASNLLGVCFVLITGLKLTKMNPLSFGDEIAWVAAFLLLTSLLMAYMSMRGHESRLHLGLWADRLFILGTLALFAAVTAIARIIY